MHVRAWSRAIAAKRLAASITVNVLTMGKEDASLLEDEMTRMLVHFVFFLSLSPLIKN